MTDKEIFAKDINVPHKEQINDSLKNSDKNFNENCTVQKNERVIVMNLSDIIKDKDATISRLQSECNEKSDMIFKLMEQLHQINLRKEQIIINGECVPVITLTRRQLEEDWYTLHQQLARKTQECEKLKEQLIQKDEVNTFFNTSIEGCSDDPCEICPYKNELQLAKQLIVGILKTLNLEAYDWRADQNEIITEIKTFEEKYEALKLENKEGYEIVDELKQECEELKEETKNLRHMYESMSELCGIKSTRQRRKNENT